MSDQAGNTEESGAWGATALGILWVLFILAAGATAHSVIVTLL